MNQMICYLYEYHGNQKIRNVGFVRVIPYGDKVVLQFHGKGLSFNGVENFQTYLFRMKDNICYVTSIGNVEGVHGNINSMIEVSGSRITEGDGLENYDGILLVQPEGQKYVATWKNVEVNVDRIQDEETMQPEVLVEPEIEQEPEALVEPEVEQEPEVQQDSEMQPEIEVGPEIAIEPEGPVEQEVVSDATNEDEPEDYIRYRKIERQDIAKLPSKEWKLANNSFLLHGYYNYKHLLFIEENGQLYLGVPGVYHQKEQEAASAFGFGQFHRVEEDLGWSEDERNAVDDFGYWCRPVSQLQPNVV